MRVALSSHALGVERGTVMVYAGDDQAMTVEALLVDEPVRRRGRATEALKLLGHLADRFGLDLHLEPVPLESGAMERDQLAAFYQRLGFAAADASGKVLVRRPAGQRQESERATHAGASERRERQR